MLRMVPGRCPPTPGYCLPSLRLEETGIDRGTLSKLENDENPSVTMNTLLRYAQAAGKVVLVQLEDAPG
jgi:hypothetical protein